MLPTLLRKLGLPAPTTDGSKRERMASSFEAVGDTDLPAVARKLLVRHPPNATTRNQIQDILGATVCARRSRSGIGARSPAAAQWRNCMGMLAGSTSC